MKTLTKIIIVAVALSGAVSFNVSRDDNTIIIETEVQNPEKIIETAGKMVSLSGEAIDQITDVVSVEEQQKSKTVRTVYHIRSGNDKYPQIISEKFFNQANEKSMSKATSICSISDELQEIRSRTYCLEYGHRLSRIGGNSRYEKWDCKNPNCFRFEYQLTDQMIIGAVLTVLNTVIVNPNLIPYR